MNNFQTPTKDIHVEQFLWNSLWWFVNIVSGNALVSLGSTPLPTSMLAQIYGVIRPQWVNDSPQQKYCLFVREHSFRNIKDASKWKKKSSLLPNHIWESLLAADKIHFRISSQTLDTGAILRFPQVNKATAQSKLSWINLVPVSGVIYIPRDTDMGGGW